MRPASSTGAENGRDCAGPRLAPGTRGQLGPLARTVARVAGRATGGEPQRVFTTLGRHRRLFRWWIPFAGTLLFRTSLPRRDVELLVLRSALNCSSPYEWAQHVPLARAAGLGSRTVRALTASSPGPAANEALGDDEGLGDNEGLSDRQRLLIEAADELHSVGVVRDRTWQGLAAELDEHELIELCMVVGHYEMLAMVLNTLGVQPEPSALVDLDDHSRLIAQLLQERVRAAASSLSIDRQDADPHPVGEPPASGAPT